MRVIAWYFLAVIIASCRLFQQQNDPLAARERTFGELSAGEQLQYLRQVLAAQGAIIRATRINRVKSLEDQLTHQVDLSVTSIDTGFQNVKLPHVSWSPVQADSIELLRCKVKDLTTHEIITSNVQPVINDKDFEKVQQEPNAYGFLSCVRVHGKIKNGTTLIDRGAENKFIYTYLFRPCFMNYALVAPATSSTVEQCGEESVKAAEGTQAEALHAKQLRLVFRYCHKDKQQVCSSVISRTEDFAYNHGVQELPLELFEQRRAKIAEIEAHENSVHTEGSEALQNATLEYNALDTALAELVKLGKSHDEVNDIRAENRLQAEGIANQIVDITNMANQNIVTRMENTRGAKHVAGKRNLSYGNDCYQDYRDTKDMYEEVNEQLKLINEEIKADTPEHLHAEIDNETEEMEMDAVTVGIHVTMCVANLAVTGHKIYKDYHNLHLVGKGEVSLAIANAAVGLVPLENSELNKGSTVNAFQFALSGIFMQENDYHRHYCQACLDHMAKYKHYSLKLFQLKAELARIEEDIERELTAKGVSDPYATP